MSGHWRYKQMKHYKQSRQVHLMIISTNTVIYYLLSTRSVLFPTRTMITSLPRSVRTSSIHLEVFRNDCLPKPNATMKLDGNSIQKKKKKLAQHIITMEKKILMIYKLWQIYSLFHHIGTHKKDMKERADVTTIGPRSEIEVKKTILAMSYTITATEESLI